MPGLLNLLTQGQDCSSLVDTALLPKRNRRQLWAEKLMKFMQRCTSQQSMEHRVRWA